MPTDPMPVANARITPEVRLGGMAQPIGETIAMDQLRGWLRQLTEGKGPLTIATHGTATQAELRAERDREGIRTTMTSTIHGVDSEFTITWPDVETTAHALIGQLQGLDDAAREIAGLSGQAAMDRRRQQDDTGERNEEGEVDDDR